MTAPAAVASADCPHENWTARAQIIREADVEGGPVVAMSIELTMTCAECQAPMWWKGVGAGSEFIWQGRTARPVAHRAVQPLVSFDRTVIMVPCEPQPPGVRA
jgi:hypothetical protein